MRWDGVQGLALPGMWQRPVRGAVEAQVRAAVPTSTNRTGKIPTLSPNLPSAQFPSTLLMTVMISP